MNRTDSVWRTWLPLAALGVLWVDLARQLSFLWSAREQYAYGWFVPFLALGLFLRRWLTRPAAQAEKPPGWLRALVALLALSLLPIRVVYEINPDWPLPAWLAAMVVVALSLYAVFLMGGRAWLAHFAFSICFILVAVSWPYRIEHALTQKLMKVVASLTVEMLGWLDLPVLQHGNLIAVGTGVVGIDEACSGIRSFQSTLMGALFMGELYLMRWPVRAAFLGGGIALAFFFNIVRTLILTWRASTAGLTGLEKWHDTAGFSIFLASFACLWASAALLARSRDKQEARQRLTPGKAVPEAQTNGRRAPVAAASLAGGGPPLALPRGYLIALGCWMLGILALTELWYRVHETKESGVFHWSLRLPEAKPGFARVELPPRTVRLLAFDEGATGRWPEEDGSEWTVNFFRWKPRSVQSIIHARLHRPDVCLPAAGYELVSDGGLVGMAAGGLELPFRQYVYKAEGRSLYVFFCQWEDGAEWQTGMHASKQADRLQSVLTGRRWLGQQTLEFIMLGYDNLDQAAQQLRQRLPALIRVEQPAIRPTGRAAAGKPSPPGRARVEPTGSVTNLRS